MKKDSTFFAFLIIIISRTRLFDQLVHLVPTISSFVSNAEEDEKAYKMNKFYAFMLIFIHVRSNSGQWTVRDNERTDSFPDQTETSDPPNWAPPTPGMPNEPGFPPSRPSGIPWNPPRRPPGRRRGKGGRTRQILQMYCSNSIADQALRGKLEMYIECRERAMVCKSGLFNFNY